MENLLKYEVLPKPILDVMETDLSKVSNTAHNCSLLSHSLVQGCFCRLQWHPLEMAGRARHMRRTEADRMRCTDLGIMAWVTGGNAPGTAHHSTTSGTTFQNYALQPTYRPALVSTSATSRYIYNTDSIHGSQGCGGFTPCWIVRVVVLLRVHRGSLTTFRSLSKGNSR